MIFMWIIYTAIKVIPIQ